MAYEISNTKENYHKEFSADVIRSIRNLYIQGLTQRRLANEFEVSLKAIYNIIHCISYNHITMSDDYAEKLKEIGTRKRSK